MLRITKNLIFITLTGILISSCQERTLPVLGNKYVENGDTVYHTVDNYFFYNQYGEKVLPKDLKGKVYVADFFFTSCPTICPKMKEQMKRIHDRFKDEEDFAILSHTIDSKHDTIELLNRYAENMNVNNSNWWFLWNNQDTTYRIAEKEYMVAANEDPKAPGGYVHSGAFILIDKKGRIRGYYDGTKELPVSQLIEDIKLLL